MAQPARREVHGSRHTLYGPRGVRLVLDHHKIYPKDPGQDTPAMVEYGVRGPRARWTATYWCACSEGEVCGWGSDNSVHTLPAVVQEWLAAQEPEIDAMYERYRADPVNGSLLN